MKKRNIGLLAVVLMAAFLIAGCGVATFGIGGGSSQKVKTVHLVPFTRSDRGTNTTYVYSVGAADQSLANVSTKTLTFPDSTSVSYNQVSGQYTANRYFFGPSGTDNGTIKDPMSETTQRQLYTQASYQQPLNGTYRAVFDNKVKDFNLTLVDYLPVISRNYVVTGTGGDFLNITAGDTITLNNQANPAYRYMCRVYDTLLDSTTYEAYWTSIDVRNLSWTNADNLANFFSGLTAPTDGKVTFTIPGHVLNQGTDNLLVYITGYDTSNTSPDLAGDFETLTLPQTEIILNLSGQ